MFLSELPKGTVTTLRFSTFTIREHPTRDQTLLYRHRRYHCRYHRLQSLLQSVSFDVKLLRILSWNFLDNSRNTWRKHEHEWRLRSNPTPIRSQFTLLPRIAVSITTEISCHVEAKPGEFCNQKWMPCLLWDTQGRLITGRSPPSAYLRRTLLQFQTNRAVQ